MANKGLFHDTSFYDTLSKDANHLQELNERLAQNYVLSVDMGRKKVTYVMLCIIEKTVKRMKNLLENDFLITDYETSMKSNNQKGSVAPFLRTSRQLIIDEYEEKENKK